MNMTNFDTLKAAKSLQDAGFEVQQAEAVVGMVTYALSEGLATKDDVRELNSRLGSLENKVAALDSKIDHGIAALDTKIGALDTKIGALDSKIDHGIAALDTKFEALDTKFEALDTKFEALDTKFEALDTKYEGLNAKIGALDTKFEGLNAKIDAGLNHVTQKLILCLGGIVIGAITLLEVLNRIFPVVPAP